jgi:CxxC motif-containing protein
VAEGQAKHKLLCIVCPEGCEIEVQEKDGGYVFSEGICRRGRDYARRELRNPVRTVTSTVPVAGGEIAMLPVRAAAPIPKKRIMEAMAQIKGITITAPVEIGQTVAENLAGSGVPLVASRSIRRSRDG